MLRHRPRFFSPIFRASLIALAALHGLTLAQQVTVPPHAPQVNTPDAYAWQRAPVRLTSEPSDPRQASLLAARGAFFDREIGAPVPLDKPSSLTYGRSAGGGIREEFPTSTIDAAVVATFRSSSPHLSPSHLSVYTEVKMHCESVAYAKNGGAAPDALLTVLIPGGTVVMPGSDKAISYGIERAPFGIAPGQTYLLFLRYQSDGSFYTVRKSWLVRNQVLVANSVFDSRRAEDSSSIHAGQKIDKALQEIRSAASR